MSFLVPGSWVAGDFLIKSRYYDILFAEADFVNQVETLKISDFVCFSRCVSFFLKL